MTRQNWLLILTLSLLWGGSFLFVEVALSGLPPLVIVWLRVTLAAGVLGMVLWVAKMPFPPRRTFGALLVMGLLNNAVPFSLFAVAQGQITGALAAVLNATTPLFTLVVAHVATRDDRMTLNKVFGLLLGVAGVIVMMSGATLQGDTTAKAMCLVAALSYACAAVWGRRFRQSGLAPLTTAFGQVAGSSVLMLPVMIWLHPIVHWPGTNVAGAIVGISVLSTALAYLIYFRLLEKVGATKLSIVTFLIPVSAAVLGAVFLGERLEPQHWAGFTLIALGLLAIDGRVVTWRSAA